MSGRRGEKNEAFFKIKIKKFDPTIQESRKKMWKLSSSLL